MRIRGGEQDRGSHCATISDHWVDLKCLVACLRVQKQGDEQLSNKEVVIEELDEIWDGIFCSSSQASDVGFPRGKSNGDIARVVTSLHYVRSR